MKQKRKLAISYTNLLELYKEIDTYVDKQETVCKKGCSYCCHQVVSIFEFEKMYIKDAIKKLPSTIKEKVKQNFHIAKEHVMENTKGLKEIDFGTFQLGYGRQMAADFISCPLLVDNLCSIYESRPLECRWHFVKEEPIYCAMNRMRDASQESLGFQAKFAMFMINQKTSPQLQMLMPVLKDIFDKDGKMIKILKTNIE